MRYEVVRAREPHDCWHVEAIEEGEGRIFAACFFGGDDEERAREYAAWKNGDDA